MFSFHKNKFPIGVDISGGSVKIVQLGLNNKKQISIHAFTLIPLPKGVVVEDVIMDSQTLSFQLKQAIEKPKFGTFYGNRVCVSLPEAKSFVRVIHIPHMSDAEVDQAIPFEAESYIPIPIEQVYLDWEKLEEENGRMAILLIATPKENGDKFLSVFDKMKLTPEVLEVESQSVQRALVKQGTEPTFLVADINDHKTNLVMIQKGKLLFTSSIPVGGNQFSEVLAKQLGISIEKAEALKIETGLNNTAEYPNIKLSMLPILKNLAAEIKNVLQFQSEHSQVKIEKVVLCGGGARLKGISENLALEFEGQGLGVELANALVNIPATEKSPMTPEEGLDYAAAIGLALRSGY